MIVVLVIGGIRQLVDKSVYGHMTFVLRGLLTLIAKNQEENELCKNR